MNWLTEMDMNDVRVGDILRFNVTRRSHEDKPYYVKVVRFTKEELVTTIPGKHTLEIEYGTPEWNYHIPRIEYIGSFAEFGHLLHGQKFKLKE